MAERDHRSPAHDDTVSIGDASVAPPPEIEPGAVFAGRYRIDERLGQGAMGVVYRVHDLSLDEPVALKVMTFTAGEAAQRFVEEVRLARRVTHPNVARTHDIGEHQGVAYLTMEYVQGETLEAFIERHGVIAPEQAATLTIQLARALETAHAAGVIHRDLKPSNVIIASDGRAVITDFGIARAVRREDARRTVGIIGTPAYMSPEQASSGPIDARSDIYTLGIILYELCTARLPFEEEEPVASALARLRRAPTHLNEHQAVPAPLAELTMWMLARDREARPASAQVVRESLEAFLAGRAQPTATGRSATAAVSPGDRTVAVLPFRYRGAADHDFLGEGLAEELIDMLSRTRGIKVLALGATARFTDERDPTRVAAELSADAVVDGAVQHASGRLRVTVRMSDARGIQLWNDRFDVPVEDLMSLQESLGKRLAEALRLELKARISESAHPVEATELYMRARRIHRSGTVGRSEESLQLLERCLELAPDLLPALAMHAMSAVRSWWLEGKSEAGARRERAERSVARAASLAPDEPETPLAQASFAMQLGEYRTTAQALARALELAPTLAEAQQQLGALEVEAGRARQGVARLKLSLELDPNLNASRLHLARVLAYDERYDESDRLLREFSDSCGEHHPGLLIARLRQAIQKRDDAALAHAIEQIEVSKGIFTDTGPFFRVALGKAATEEATDIEAAILQRFANARFQMSIGQVATEVLAYAGHVELALKRLAPLADGILVDIVWLDDCAVLEPLRQHTAYAEAAAKVRHRAAATWLP